MAKRWTRWDLVGETAAEILQDDIQQKSLIARSGRGRTANRMRTPYDMLSGYDRVRYRKNSKVVNSMILPATYAEMKVQEPDIQRKMLLFIMNQQKEERGKLAKSWNVAPGLFTKLSQKLGILEIRPRDDTPRRPYKKKEKPEEMQKRLELEAEQERQRLELEQAQAQVQLLEVRAASEVAIVNEQLNGRLSAIEDQQARIIGLLESMLSKSIVAATSEVKSVTESVKFSAKQIAELKSAGVL